VLRIEQDFMLGRQELCHFELCPSPQSHRVGTLEHCLRTQGVLLTTDEGDGMGCCPHWISRISALRTISQEQNILLSKFTAEFPYHQLD
jgi:hypothetical protein